MSRNVLIFLAVMLCFEVALCFWLPGISDEYNRYRSLEGGHVERALTYNSRQIPISQREQNWQMTLTEQNWQMTLVKENWQRAMTKQNRQRQPNDEYIIRILDKLKEEGVISEHGKINKFIIYNIYFIYHLSLKTSSVFINVCTNFGY